jgi:hypothetical protein
MNRNIILVSTRIENPGSDLGADWLRCCAIGAVLHPLRCVDVHFPRLQRPALPRSVFQRKHCARDAFPEPHWRACDVWVILVVIPARSGQMKLITAAIIAILFASVTTAQSQQACAANCQAMFSQCLQVCGQNCTTAGISAAISGAASSNAASTNPSANPARSPRYSVIVSPRQIFAFCPAQARPPQARLHAEQGAPPAKEST